jgi:hypothetical protein
MCFKLKANAKVFIILLFIQKKRKKVDPTKPLPGTNVEGTALVFTSISGQLGISLA